MKPHHCRRVYLIGLWYWKCIVFFTQIIIKTKRHQCKKFHFTNKLFWFVHILFVLKNLTKHWYKHALTPLLLFIFYVQVSYCRSPFSLISVRNSKEAELEIRLYQINRMFRRFKLELLNFVIFGMDRYCKISVQRT